MHVKTVVRAMLYLLYEESGHGESVWFPHRHPLHGLMSYQAVVLVREARPDIVRYVAGPKACLPCALYSLSHTKGHDRATSMRSRPASFREISLKAAILDSTEILVEVVSGFFQRQISRTSPVPTARYRLGCNIRRKGPLWGCTGSGDYRRRGRKCVRSPRECM